jgi:hypothetical protein
MAKKPEKETDACCGMPPYDLPTPPPLKRIEHDDETEKPKKGKSGIDKAMDMLDEYYEGTPTRNPNYDQEGDP